MADYTFKGLTGVYGTATVADPGVNTLGDLIVAIATAEGLPTDYYAISVEGNPAINDTVLDDSSTTVTASGLTVSDRIICTTRQQGTKERRQIQKLEIAQLKRKGTFRDTGTYTDAEDTPYFRSNNTYDATSLPDTYNGNLPGPDDNPNTGGLIQKRPWVAVGAIAAPESISESVGGDTLVDLQVWYDGSDPTTIQNAGVDEEDIEQWNDKSNFAHNANPVGGASAKPLYEASDLKNSHEYVKFDGNDILSVNPFAQLNAAEGWSMFIVANATDISANGGLCATNTGDLKIRIDADGSTSFRSTGNNYAYFGTGTITDDTWHIWSLIYDGTASGNARLIARLDKTSATLYTGTQPAQLSTGSNIMYLGSTNEAGYDLTGYMGEVIMFNRALSATEYANVENYLSNKWDI